jgi:penicillin-binding protein 1A
VAQVNRPHASARRPPLVLTGRRSASPWRVALRALFALSVSAVLAGLVAGFALYVQLSKDLPALLSVEDWRPPGVTRLLADDGRLVGELTRERRYVVPLEHVPRTVIEAFLAAEDQRFFVHAGVDYRGVLRAALANWRAGRVVEGASTLTQQLCKTLVGNERSVERKIREAILARRLESRLDKLDILWLYLNTVYLGHGAYGVQAAARSYFGKDVGQLGLAEAATLAGLPPRPSVLNPVVDPTATKARRAWVLERMVTEGFITAQQGAQAAAEPLVVLPEVPNAFDEQIPDYVEHVRRQLQAEYGGEMLHEDALTVHLAVDADLQTEATTALRRGLVALGERQGFVGPLARLAPSDVAGVVERARVRYSGQDDVPPDTWRLGVVERVDADAAEVRVGDRTYTLPVTQARWAAPWDTVRARNGQRLKRLDDALRMHDAVFVRTMDTPGVVRLAQEPPVQGAVVSMETRSGYVRAMVGGFDFDQSEYNRAFQGCRQPGSVFKPIVYARALDTGYTLGTPIADTPISEFDPANQLLWKPRNFEGRFNGDVLLYNAVIRSLNVPAIKTIDYVGPDAAVDFAKRLGLSTPMYPDRSLVLGSSCVYPWELTQVYATFALRGERPRPVFVKRIETRDGQLLEDRTHVSDVNVPAGPRLDALLRAALEPRDRVYEATTGFLVQTALRGVVERGTAVAARALGMPAAGKTGTTDAYDAWFVGFTDTLVTGVWVGSDQNRRKLGDGETGGHTALPIWLEVMRAAHGGRKAADFTARPPPGIVFADIDVESGRLAGPGRASINLPFKQGTVPVEAAPAAGAFDRHDLDSVEGRF